MTPDLFSDEPRIRVRENVDDGVVLLPGIGAGIAEALMSVVTGIAQSAPFRHMTTPGGFRMSVATANCGSLGWISDHRGYRYSPLDPVSGRPWPAMPAILADLATSAAATAGFTGFLPDACLINRYDTGTRMSLHQDRNERDFSAPIVSLSLGVTATFQLGGGKRSDPVRRILLAHGDALVWGGPARLRFHGVLPLKAGHHPLLGTQRLNFTLRKAG